MLAIGGSMPAFAVTTPAKTHGRTSARMVPITKAKSVNTPEKPYVEGFGDDTFKPDSLLTKAEFARIIHNLYGANGTTAAGISSKSTGLTGSYNIRDKSTATPRPGYLPGRAPLTPNVTNPATDDTNVKAKSANPSRTNKRTAPATMKTWAHASPATHSNAATHRTAAKTVTAKAHWGREYMEGLYNKGLVTRPQFEGNEFNPDEHVLREDFVAVLSKIKGYNVTNQIEGEASITRAEAIAFLNTLEGREKKWTGHRQFKDVAHSHWAYDDIMNAANGYNEHEG